MIDTSRNIYINICTVTFFYDNRKIRDLKNYLFIISLIIREHSFEHGLFLHLKLSFSCAETYRAKEGNISS